MAIELATRYTGKVDELFTKESKLSLLTNTNFDWTGAHSIVVYKMSTAPLNNYARNVYETDEEEFTAVSRYGNLYDLSATTEEMLLKNDKSFIFNVDKMDVEETEGSLEAETALARELREVVVPTIDSYVYNALATDSGTVATATVLDENNIYEEILKGATELDDNFVPDTERVLIVNPTVYMVLKKAVQFDHNEIGATMRLKGVVGTLDGMNVIKVPSSRLPENFGFMIVHPSACTCAIKLEDYSIHHDTVLSSGDIVTGRVVYDAFVLENKAKGVYYQPVTAQG